MSDSPEPKTVRDGLALAFEHHRAGRLIEAEELYLRVLAAELSQPDALHLLGLLYQQAGEPQAALDHLRRAVASAPQRADFHANLGVALEAMGRGNEAVNE